MQPTPLFQFPEGSLYEKLLLKREDQSEAGSHKFRFLSEKMSNLHAKGMTRMVTPTSGNAGITAAHYGAPLGIQVICFVSDRADLSKAAVIEEEGGIAVCSSRPLRLARYAARSAGVPFVRGSLSKNALKGYHSLGKELMEQAPQVEAIVAFCSGGTSIVGMSEAYLQKGTPLPALHVVQFGKSCSIVRHFHPEQVPEHPEQDAPGLSDTPRKKKLIELIKQSGGDAWYASLEAVTQAEEELKSFGIESSFESLASFSIAKNLMDRYESIAVIFSGKKWPKQDFSPRFRVESEAEVDQFLDQLS